MSVQIHASIAQLRASAPKLNEVTDNAARVVQRVEKFLNEELRVGLPISVTITGLEDAPNLQLGYERHGNTFRVTVRETSYVWEGTEIARHPEYDFPIVKKSETTAWAECQRATKLQTFTYLPKLLEAIQDRVKREIMAASDAIITVDEILTALDGEPPRGSLNDDDEEGGRPVLFEGPNGKPSGPPKFNGKPRM